MTSGSGPIEVKRWKKKRCAGPSGALRPVMRLRGYLNGRQRTGPREADGGAGTGLRAGAAAGRGGGAEIF